MRDAGRRELEDGLRPCDPDVEQASFLGDLGGLLGTPERKLPVAEPGHEHDLPLEALGEVVGGEPHGVSRLRVLVAPELILDPERLVRAVTIGTGAA